MKALNMIKRYSENPNSPIYSFHARKTSNDGKQFKETNFETERRLEKEENKWRDEELEALRKNANAVSMNAALDSVMKRVAGFTCQHVREMAL